MAKEAGKKRHPFRFMFKLLAFAGILYVAGRVVVAKKDEYYGISESEARAKLTEKLAPRIGEDSAAELADQLIPKLKSRGFVTPDSVAEEKPSEGEPATEE